MSLVDPGRARHQRRRLLAANGRRHAVPLQHRLAGIFQTLHIPLLAGRDFARTDDTNAQPAVIVNETMARRFWQTPENAIGKRLRSGTMNGAR